MPCPMLPCLQDQLKALRAVYSAVYQLPATAAVSRVLRKGRKREMSVAFDAGERVRVGVFRASWKFRIGEVVLFGDLSAIVLSRQCSAMGRQIFHLWIAGDTIRSLRWVLADALVRVEALSG